MYADWPPSCFQMLLAQEGLDLHFTPASLKEMARIAEEVNQNLENLGARRLHTVSGTLAAAHWGGVGVSLALGSPRHVSLAPESARLHERRALQ